VHLSTYGTMRFEKLILLRAVTPRSLFLMVMARNRATSNFSKFLWLPRFSTIATVLIFRPVFSNGRIALERLQHVYLEDLPFNLMLSIFLNIRSCAQKAFNYGKKDSLRALFIRVAIATSRAPPMIQKQVK